MHHKKVNASGKYFFITLTTGVIMLLTGFIMQQYFVEKNSNGQPENTSVRHLIGNFKLDDSKLLIACWVRQNAEMGYDTNGHFISPADVPLNKIDVTETNKGYVIGSSYFVSNQLKDRNKKIVYQVISLSNGKYWEVLFPNSKEKMIITRDDLIDHYSASIK